MKPIPNLNRFEKAAKEKEKAAATGETCARWKQGPRGPGFDFGL